MGLFMENGVDIDLSAARGTQTLQGLAASRTRLVQSITKSRGTPMPTSFSLTNQSGWATLTRTLESQW